MAKVTRRIGLSLGADICWPICYEEIVRRLDLAIPVGGDTVGFEVERVTIEPFDLRQGCRYDVVLDRLTHWYHTSREWIKKAVVMDDLYVLNNPWSMQSNEKHTSYAAMMRLGFPIPETWLVPPKAYDPREDLQVTLERYAKLFDLAKVGQAVGYPAVHEAVRRRRLGGREQGRRRRSSCAAAYDESGTRVMHLQKAVLPFDLFVRASVSGRRCAVMRYDPGAPLHDRYKMDFDFVSAAEHRTLADTVLTINSFFGWDFNSCESLRQDGVFYPIDFANPCPDSQVTSLHYHFPWLVKAKIRWSVFAAVTGRRMRKNLDWEPFYEVARRTCRSREARALRADRPRALRHRPLRGVLRHAPRRTSTRWPGSSSAPTSPRTRCARRSPRSSRRTRSSSSPSSSGGSSSSGEGPKPNGSGSRLEPARGLALPAPRRRGRGALVGALGRSGAALPDGGRRRARRRELRAGRRGGPAARRRPRQALHLRRPRRPCLGARGGRRPSPLLEAERLRPLRRRGAGAGDPPRLRRRARARHRRRLARRLQRPRRALSPPRPSTAPPCA